MVTKEDLVIITNDALKKQNKEKEENFQNIYKECYERMIFAAQNGMNYYVFKRGANKNQGEACQDFLKHLLKTGYSLYIAYENKIRFEENYRITTIENLEDIPYNSNIIVSWS